jgi:hypothetical protein
VPCDEECGHQGLKSQDQEVPIGEVDGPLGLAFGNRACAFFFAERGDEIVGYSRHQVNAHQPSVDQVGPHAPHAWRLFRIGTMPLQYNNKANIKNYLS